MSWPVRLADISASGDDLFAVSLEEAGVTHTVSVKVKTSLGHRVIELLGGASPAAAHAFDRCDQRALARAVIERATVHGHAAE